MGAPALHGTRPDAGQADLDVLEGADERRPGHRSVLASAAVVAALLFGMTAVDRAPAPEPEPLLVLRDAELVTRDRPIGDRLAEAGMHVEVVNTSDVIMVVRGASLVPGTWAVEVVDRPLLRPGQSVVLSLHRTVRCDERASNGAVPEHLVVEASTDDATLAVRLAVDDPAAYGGRLDDALRDPGRACVVTDDVVSGPIGDLVGEYRARRATSDAPGS